MVTSLQARLETIQEKNEDHLEAIQRENQDFYDRLYIDKDTQY